MGDSYQIKDQKGEAPSSLMSTWVKELKLMYNKPTGKTKETNFFIILVLG